MHCARHVAVLLTSGLATEAHQVRGGGRSSPSASRSAITNQHDAEEDRVMRTTWV